MTLQAAYELNLRTILYKPGGINPACHSRVGQSFTGNKNRVANFGA